MISEGQEAWEEAVAGGRGSELGVFLTDSGEEHKEGGDIERMSLFGLIFFAINTTAWVIDLLVKVKPQNQLCSEAAPLSMQTSYTFNQDSKT